MTNETEAPELSYLIRKNGMFYRPDSCGYTSAKSEAGLYSLKDAISITHPNGIDGPRDGMTYTHETEVVDPRANLSDAKDKRIAELEAKLHIYESRNGQPVSSTGMVDEMADALKQKDKRIAELEATLQLERQSPWVVTDSEMKRRAEAAEAKLAKAMDGLRECEGEIDQYIRNEYPHDHPVQERYRKRDYAANPARKTFAEIQGNPNGDTNE